MKKKNEINILYHYLFIYCLFELIKFNNYGLN